MIKITSKKQLAPGLLYIETQAFCLWVFGVPVFVFWWNLFLLKKAKWLAQRAEGVALCLIDCRAAPKLVLDEEGTTVLPAWELVLWTYSFESGMYQVRPWLFCQPGDTNDALLLLAGLTAVTHFPRSEQKVWVRDPDSSHPLLGRREIILASRSWLQIHMGQVNSRRPAPRRSISKSQEKVNARAHLTFLWNSAGMK